MTWNEFFAMGGYALYVWGSVWVVFGFIAVELMELVWRRKVILSELSFSKMIKVDHENTA
jgi:heme exporter protein D